MTVLVLIPAQEFIIGIVSQSGSLTPSLGLNEALTGETIIVSTYKFLECEGLCSSHMLVTMQNTIIALESLLLAIWAQAVFGVLLVSADPSNSLWIDASKVLLDPVIIETSDEGIEPSRKLSVSPVQAVSTGKADFRALKSKRFAPKPLQLGDNANAHTSAVQSMSAHACLCRSLFSLSLVLSCSDAHSDSCGDNRTRRGKTCACCVPCSSGGKAGARCITCPS